MRPQLSTTIATYSLLSLAGIVSFMLPNQLPTSTAAPIPPPAVNLNGTAHELHSGQRDAKRPQGIPPRRVSEVAPSKPDSD